MFFRVVSRRQLMLLALALLTLLALLLLPFLSARAAFSPAPESRALPILMYHSLLRDEGRWGEYVVSPAQLESDLIALRERGYAFVSIAEVITFVTGDGALPEKPVLITLDDGYLNNLTYLPDILERQDACAVIGVVGEYTDIFSLQEDHNPNYSHMNWDDLRTVSASARLELGNHSYYFHHQGARRGAMRKKGEGRAQWLTALRSDAAALQQRLREEGCAVPQVYVYPYGQISDGADECLREMGFEASLSCYERVSVLTRGDAACLFSLGRFNRPSGERSEDFLERVLGDEGAPTGAPSTRDANPSVTAALQQ